jgi:uncharacterized protein (TIGR03083 family)
MPETVGDPTSDCIETVELFPRLGDKLAELLKSLSPEDFDKPTQFPSWKVKDICAHLLDTSLRRLSSERDRYASSEKAQIASNADLIRHVTSLADRWASAFAGVSPHILIELIEKYQTELYEYFRSLPPHGVSTFPVSWAGEQVSENWFDIAREFTERWHHQMQIREALQQAPIYERELYHPVLDTFMRALPYHFRGVHKAEGYRASVHIEGGAGGTWGLVWRNGSAMPAGDDASSDTTITIQQDVAWKIFTRWADASEYRIAVEGDPALGERIKSMSCILIQ